MNKNELIEALAAKTGSTRAEAARAVTALTEIITCSDLHLEMTRPAFSAIFSQK